MVVLRGGALSCERGNPVPLARVSLIPNPISNHKRIPHFEPPSQITKSSFLAPSQITHPSFPAPSHITQPSFLAPSQITYPSFQAPLKLHNPHFGPLLHTVSRRKNSLLGRGPSLRETFVTILQGHLANKKIPIPLGP